MRYGIIPTSVEYYKILSFIHCLYAKHIKGVELADFPTFYGRPMLARASGAKIIIGKNARFFSNRSLNVAGIYHPCSLAAIGTNSVIKIGTNCGFSGVILVAQTSIEIGDFCYFGANAKIYDTDFHVEDPFRRRKQLSPGEAISKPVKIGNDVWVGSDVLILKGVTVGDAAIIGARSVVTKNVLAGTIVAGNPARLIRSIHSIPQ